MTAFDQSAGHRTRPANGEDLGEREWLLTDGLGGYACGTASELPRRRYHCWLSAASVGGRRRRLLAGVDERLVGADEQPLTPAHWRSLPAPSLPDVQRTFRADPVPTWTLRRDGVQIERSLAMPRGRAAILVTWRNIGAEPLRLDVRPLLAGEDADALLRERPVDESVAERDGAFAFRLSPDDPPLWLSLDGSAEFRPDPCWYRDYHHDVDEQRGYDSVADRYSPGVIELELLPEQSATVAFAVHEPEQDPAAAFAAAVAARTARLRSAAGATGALATRLRRGVDDFFYRDSAGRLGVLAGFPWFSEWGRDVFVALPGLTLAAGQPERCLEVMRGALPFLRRGLLPNIYGPTPDESHYDSADAALWFSLCVQRWQDAAGDATAARAEFGPALLQIGEAYLEGTNLGLRVDDEGLLNAGLPDRNATWMDAQTANGPVTPRDGQPVEIVAMWCALLQHLGELYGAPWTDRAAVVGRAFLARFWRGDAGCLFDRRSDGRGDPAVRPNMVIAAALPRSPLSAAQRRAIVEVAARELVTPRGLRTLSPRDPAYVGRYEGGPEERDRAYHQGTAWPWLGGFHVEAALRGAGAGDTLAAERARQLAWLQGFLPEVDRAGIDHLSEVFDGDAPQRPGGTFAQAWNTGELLRALLLCEHGPDGAAR